MDLCGICSEESEFLVSFHELYLKKHNLKLIVHELTQVEFTEYECSEAWICDVCADKLIDFHAFREKLFGLHKKLEQIKWTQDSAKQVNTFESDGADQVTPKDVDTESVAEDVSLLGDKVKNEGIEDSEMIEVDEVNPLFEKPLHMGSGIVNNVTPLECVIVKQRNCSGQNTQRILKIPASLKITRISKLTAQSTIGNNLKKSSKYKKSHPSSVPRIPHLRSSSSSKPLDVDQCPPNLHPRDLQLTRPKNLQYLEEKTKHGKGKNNVEAYTKNISGRVPCDLARICSLCFSQLYDSSAFRKHLLRIHAIDCSAQGVQRKRIICDKCKVPYSSLFNRTRHKCDNFMQSLEQKQVPMDNLVCPGCSFVFDCANSFRCHTKSIHNLTDDIVDLFLRPWTKFKESLDSKSEKQIAGSSSGLSSGEHVDPCERHIDPLESDVEEKEKAENVAESTSNQVERLVRADNVRGNKCSQCHRILKNRLKLFEHKLFYHMKVGKETRKQCPLCIQMIVMEDSWDRLKRHIKKQHRDVKEELERIRLETGEILCPECDEPFIDVVTMYDHFKTHDALNYGDNADGYNFNCESCNVTLDDLDEYEEHQQNVHKIILRLNIMPIKCAWCGQRFKKFKVFRHHLQSYHDRAPITKEVLPDSLLCTTCGKTFANRHNLQIHLLTHTEDAPIKCKLCTTVLKHERALKRHMENVHGTIDKRRCDICGKEIKVSCFNKHLRTHNVDKIKMHDCKICGKQFNNLYNFQAHMWIHRDGFPYNCIFCKKGFMRKKKMNEHIELEHQAGDRELEHLEVNNSV